MTQNAIMAYTAIMTQSAVSIRTAASWSGQKALLQLVGRLLLGLPFLVAGLYKFIDPTATGESASAPGEEFFDAARATFIFAELAIVEVIGAVLILTGIAVPFATLGFVPLVVTIVVYSIAYVPFGIESTLVVSIVLGCGILLAVHRRRYADLFVPSPLGVRFGPAGRSVRSEP